MINNINDKKYKDYRKKQILRYLYIILCFTTIFLESLALFGTISYLWGLIPFVICYIIKYFFVDKEDKNKEKKNKKHNQKK